MVFLIRVAPCFQRFTFFVIAAMLLASLFAGAQDFTLTKLPAGTIAVAINASGQVIGYTADLHHAFRWTRTGGLQILPGLSGPSDVRAINDNGVIVGDSALSDGTFHAVLWTPNGGITDLGSPLGGNSEALFINSAGQVAGQSNQSGTTNTHAFFWSAGTGAVDLGVTSGYNQSFPFGINNSGEIVGRQAQDGNHPSTFRWTLATGMENSTTFSLSFAPFHSPQLIGDNGAIAGMNLSYQAELWLPGDVIQQLGTLPPDETSVALFVNNAGHVVGSSKPTQCCGPNRTFFWSEETGMVDIGHLSNHPNSSNLPYGFNNRDQIFGRAGATYFWSPTLGIRQVPGVGRSDFVLKGLNDAGQVLGANTSGAVVASPAMHVNLSSSLNPSHSGQSVTFTASVSSFVGLPPNGEQVTFKDGSKVLGTASLSNGIGTFTTSSLTVKSHSISAIYGGDDNYVPSKPAKLQQVVNP
jgi:probable HAF family extracellular repeat protein